MQYLVSVIDDTAGLATPDEMAVIDVFNDRLKAQGHWVFAGGLGDPRRPAAPAGPQPAGAPRTTKPSSWRATPPRPPT